MRSYVLGAVAALALCHSFAPVAAAQQGTPESAVQRAGNATVEPGDRVVVKVFREPALSDALTVDARGDIVVPKVGTVHVAGSTILAVQDTLRARFAGFLREPAVEVNVLRRVIVNGEVPKPGVYYVDIGTATIRDVVALAGGVSPYGHSSRVSIVRDGQRIEVENWERSELPSADLRSGDQVYVGRRSWLALNLGTVVGAVGLVSSIVLTIISMNR